MSPNQAGPYNTFKQKFPNMFSGWDEKKIQNEI